MSRASNQDAINQWSEDWAAVIEDLNADFEVKNLSFGSQIAQSGEFSFENFSPGTYKVSASKGGYYPASREITLNPGDPRHEVFYLLTVQQAEDPGVFEFQSPQGKHFIEGPPAC